MSSIGMLLPNNSAVNIWIMERMRTVEPQEVQVGSSRVRLRSGTLFMWLQILHLNLIKLSEFVFIGLTLSNNAFSRNRVIVEAGQCFWF